MPATYLPPSARMRQIKAETFNRKSADPVPPGTPAAEVPVAEAAPVVIEVPKAVEKPEFSANMRKADLLKIALDFKLAVTEENTKAEILAALESV